MEAVATFVSATKRYSKSRNSLNPDTLRFERKTNNVLKSLELQQKHTHLMVLRTENGSGCTIRREWKGSRSSMQFRVWSAREERDEESGHVL